MIIRDLLEIKYIIVVIMTTLIIGSMIFLGIGSEEKVKGTCYTKIESCSGLSVGDKCYGAQTTEFDYMSRDRCDQIQNITFECNKLRRAICQSEKIEDKGWIKKAETEGKSCKIWKEQYELNLSESC